VAHPSPELLLSLATGRADLPHRVMLEAHLAGCPECRATAAEIAAPGGALLGGLAGAPPPAALWERLRERIAAVAPSVRPEPSPALAGVPLAAAARAELPPEVLARPNLRWRWGLAPGARMAVLARDPVTRSILLIGHIPPRRTFPRHLHLGPEDVQILTGAYRDEMGDYEAGSYTAYEPGTVHRPVIEPGDTCWTLTRLEKPNRILGWQGWLLRLFS
jgi:putative transcriptional regulator